MSCCTSDAAARAVCTAGVAPACCRRSSDRRQRTSKIQTWIPTTVVLAGAKTYAVKTFKFIVEMLLEDGEPVPESEFIDVRTIQVA